MDAELTAAHNRGLRRDLDTLGAGWRPELAEFWSRWVAAEQAHFAADPTADRADLIVSPPGDRPPEAR